MPVGTHWAALPSHFWEGRRSLRSSLACSDAKPGEIFRYPHNLGDYRREVSSSKSKLKTHEPRSEAGQFKGNNLYICELSDTLPAENVHRGGALKETLCSKACATFDSCRNVTHFSQVCACIIKYIRLPLSTDRCDTNPPSGSAMRCVHPFPLFLCI